MEIALAEQGLFVLPAKVTQDQAKEKAWEQKLIAEHRELIRLAPDDAHAHSGLAAALGHQGDERGALQEYRRANELDPKEPAIHSAYERLREKLQN